MAGGWGLKSFEDCVDLIKSQDYASAEGIYCNATWDGVLCWPATHAGETAELPCPPIIPLDQTKSASRVCESNGTWYDRSLNSGGHQAAFEGRTNYAPCFTELTMTLFHSIAVNIPLTQQKIHGFGAMILETVGLLVSLLSLVISTFIFCYFRSIRSSHRIRIHRNLFVSVLIYTLVLLIKNIDQAIAVKVPNAFVYKGLSLWSTRFFCESLIVLVEFTKSAMFSWMLIQGLHLQITLTHVFNVTPNYKLYYGIGWGAPVLITTPWAIMNCLWNQEWCWYGYTYQKYFWAIEAPRFLILFVNLCFLVCVVRTLVSKLRSNRSPEKEQIKKSVKALLFLLPPLGANNLLPCIWPPNRSVALFALHLYFSHFLSSIQGFLMALFFCFLNSEVKSALGEQWRRTRQSRLSVSSAHGSTLNKSQFTCLSEVGVEGRSRSASGRISDATNRTSIELFRHSRHGTISSEDGFDESNF